MSKDLKEVLVSLVSVCQQLVIHQTLVSGFLTEKLPGEQSSILNPCGTRAKDHNSGKVVANQIDIFDVES